MHHDMADNSDTFHLIILPCICIVCSFLQSILYAKETKMALFLQDKRPSFNSFSIHNFHANSSRIWIDCGCNKLCDILYSCSVVEILETDKNDNILEMYVLLEQTQSLKQIV